MPRPDRPPVNLAAGPASLPPAAPPDWRADLAAIDAELEAGALPRFAPPVAPDWADPDPGMECSYGEPPRWPRTRDPADGVEPRPIGPTFAETCRDSWHQSQRGTASYVRRRGRTEDRDKAIFVMMESRLVAPARVARARLAASKFGLTVRQIYNIWRRKFSEWVNKQRALQQRRLRYWRQNVDPWSERNRRNWPAPVGDLFSPARTGPMAYEMNPLKDSAISESRNPMPAAGGGAVGNPHGRGPPAGGGAGGETAGAIQGRTGGPAEAPPAGGGAGGEVQPLPESEGGLPPAEIDRIRDLVARWKKARGPHYRPGPPWSWGKPF